MNERIMQFRVGLMVFATLLILGILTAMFGEMPKLIHGEYKLYITFYQAPGVNEGTSVRKSGILIGRVTNVHFADDDAAEQDHSLARTGIIASSPVRR